MSEQIDIRYMINADEVTQQAAKVDKAIEQNAATYLETGDDIKANIKEQIATIKELEAELAKRDKKLSEAAPSRERNAMMVERNQLAATIKNEKQALEELQNAQSQVDKSSQSLRTQLMNIRNQMATMVEGTDEYTAAMHRLGELQDQYGDIQAQGRIFADDFKYFNLAREGLQGFAGVMSAATGVASLFGASQEKLAAIQARLQAVMAISIGIQQVAQTLDKDSYVMHLLIPKVKAIHAAVQTKLTVALWGSTVAAKAFMIAITGGLILAVTAIISLVERWNLKQEQARLKSEEIAKANADFAKSVADSAASQIASYRQLRLSWNKLGDDLKAKRKYIKDNQSAFNDLGISIKNINDADNVFVRQTQAVINSMMYRAKAAAAEKLAKEQFEKAITKQIEAERRGLTDADKKAATTKGTYVYTGGSAGAPTSIITPDKVDMEKAQQYAKAGKAMLEFEAKGYEYIGESYFKVQQEMSDKAKTSLEQAGVAEFKPAGPADNSAKAKDAWLKADNDLKNRMVQVAYETDQAIIDAKEEGFAKKKEQIDLSYRKQLTAIELWEQEQLQAVRDAQKAQFVAQGGDEKKFVFDPNNPSVQPAVAAIDNGAAQKRSAALEQQKREQKSLLDSLKEQWQGWADEYQQVEDRITKVKEKAERDRKQIAQGKSSGMLTSDVATGALAVVDKGEVDQISTLETEKIKLSADWVRVFRDIEGMSRQEIKTLIANINNQLASSKLSPADASALQEQLEKLKSYTISKNPFINYLEGLASVKTATEKVILAQQKLNNASGDQAKRAAQKELDEAKAEKKAAEKFTADSAKAALGDVASVASAVSGMLKTFGVESPEIDGVVGALGSLATIDFTNPISIITGGIQAISSLLGGLFGGADRAHQRAIEESRRRVKIYQESLEDLNRQIDKMLGGEQYQQSGKQIELIRKQQLELARQIREEGSKKDSDSGAIADMRSQIKDLDYQIEDLLDKLKTDILGGTGKDFAQSLGEALFGGLSEGKDKAIEAWDEAADEIVANMIQKMLIVKFLEEPMQKLVDDFYDKANPSADAAAKAADDKATLEDEGKKLEQELKKLKNTPIYDDPNGNNRKARDKKIEEYKKRIEENNRKIAEAEKRMNDAQAQGVDINKKNAEELNKDLRDLGEAFYEDIVNGGFEDWFKDAKNENEKSIYGAIRGTVATEQSVSQLDGRFHYMGDKLASIDMRIDLGFAQVAQIARTNVQIEANTRRTADNTDGVMDALNGLKTELGIISKNTKQNYEAR